MRYPSGWIINKYKERNILPFPSGEYDSFQNEIKRYVTDIIDNMNLGSDVKDTALIFSNSIYWEAARPSTLAGVCVLLSGSLSGLPFKEFLLDLSKTQRKMKYTYLNWKPIVENLIGGMPNTLNEIK